MKGMYGGPGDKKVARAEKKVAKAAKNLITSRDTPSEYDRKKAIQGKTEAKVAKAVSKLDKAKAAVKPVAKAVGKGLSELNKFDKRIKTSTVAKEAKPAAKAFNKMIKNRK
jgi:hypothetical protein